MTEHWEKTIVIGRGPEDRYAKETVLHKRGADALGMAMRRNQMMPGCDWFEIETTDAFLLEKVNEDTRRKEDIPRDKRGEEWEW